MYILSHHAYEMVFLLITVLFVITAIGLTYVFYRKKDFLV